VSNLPAILAFQTLRVTAQIEIEISGNTIGYIKLLNGIMGLDGTTVSNCSFSIVIRMMFGLGQNNDITVGLVKCYIFHYQLFS
jgi:hypothetical protein